MEMDLWRQKGLGLVGQKQSTLLKNNRVHECDFSTIVQEEDVRLGGQLVPKKDIFRCSGSMLQKDGDIDEDVSHRSKNAWLKWRQASGVLCDPRITQKLKGNFYWSEIRPTMLYETKC
jgi:hypothetical protein